MSPDLEVVVNDRPARQRPAGGRRARRPAAAGPPRRRRRHASSTPTTTAPRSPITDQADGDGNGLGDACEAATATPGRARPASRARAPPAWPPGPRRPPERSGHDRSHGRDTTGDDGSTGTDSAGGTGGESGGDGCGCRSADAGVADGGLAAAVVAGRGGRASSSRGPHGCERRRGLADAYRRPGFRRAARKCYTRGDVWSRPRHRRAPLRQRIDPPRARARGDPDRRLRPRAQARGRGRRVHVGRGHPRHADRAARAQGGHHARGADLPARTPSTPRCFATSTSARTSITRPTRTRPGATPRRSTRR
jgi:hypothetical protein